MPEEFRALLEAVTVLILSISLLGAWLAILSIRKDMQRAKERADRMEYILRENGFLIPDR